MRAPVCAQRRPRRAKRRCVCDDGFGGGQGERARAGGRTRPRIPDLSRGACPRSLVACTLAMSMRARGSPSGIERSSLGAVVWSPGSSGGLLCPHARTDARTSGDGRGRGRGHFRFGIPGLHTRRTTVHPRAARRRRASIGALMLVSLARLSVVLGVVWYSFEITRCRVSQDVSIPGTHWPVHVQYL